MKKFSTLSTLCLLTLSLWLQACAPVIVAGAATGASIANDRRTAGTILEDQSIELKAGNALNSDEALAKNTNISITSYNNIVLLTGQAENQTLLDKAISHIRRIEKVKEIHNEIEIGKPTSLGTRSNDAWLTTKVKSTLLGAKGLTATYIKVVTENSVVYMMGIVTREEGNTAAETARQVEGVARVVKVFEYE